LTDRITWAQALAWRLTRHHLVERAAPADLLRVVGDLCGLHAQVMSSAELTVWARIDGLERDAVQQALWKRRTLVKLWGVRGTLHLIPARELGVWLSALGTITNRGMTGHEEIDALTDAIGEALDGQVLSREELAQEIEERTGDPTLAEYIRFSWGSYLKPASFRGLLCFAASDDGRARFTSPASFVRRPIVRPDREDALREVTRRFLSAYAPAKVDDLGLWSGFGRARAKRMLAALGADAVEVDVGGDRAWMLARDVDALASADVPDTARLLPGFDQWVVGTARYLPAQLDPELKARVYRPQGWISPVILVNGRMAGVWRHERKGQRLAVELEPFGRLPRWARAQLDDEAERLADFLGLELSPTTRTSRGSRPST
jgi:Winged helix DNA-binding domain